jgi:hypothetical protein
MESATDYSQIPTNLINLQQGLLCLPGQRRQSLGGSRAQRGYPAMQVMSSALVGSMSATNGVQDFSCSCVFRVSGISQILMEYSGKPLVWRWKSCSSIATKSLLSLVFSDDIVLMFY